MAYLKTFSNVNILEKIFKDLTPFKVLTTLFIAIPIVALFKHKATDLANIYQLLGISLAGFLSIFKLISLCTSLDKMGAVINTNLSNDLISDCKIRPKIKPQLTCMMEREPEAGPSNPNPNPNPNSNPNPNPNPSCNSDYDPYYNASYNPNNPNSSNPNYNPNSPDPSNPNYNPHKDPNLEPVMPSWWEGLDAMRRERERRAREIDSGVTTANSYTDPIMGWDPLKGHNVPKPTTAVGLELWIKTHNIISNFKHADATKGYERITSLNTDTLREYLAYENEAYQNMKTHISNCVYHKNICPEDAQATQHLETRLRNVIHFRQESINKITKEIKSREDYLRRNSGSRR